MQCTSTNTPVLLIIFNRPDTAKLVFQAIAKARPTKLYIAADAPRPGVEGEDAKCQAARDIVGMVDWDCEVKTLYRETNLGCKLAVSSAVDWLFEHEEEGIILEDDCLPAASFFGYCAELLSRYRDDQRIMMIAGTNIHGQSADTGSSYYFSKIMHIWGWATWKRAWMLNDVSMKTFPEFLCSERHEQLFTDRNIGLYWLRLWLYTYAGRINTWDYAWVYACHTNHGLAIAPTRNLISNIGFGSDSTHTKNVHSKSADIPRHEIKELVHPRHIFCNAEADQLEYEDLRVYPAKPNPSLKYRLKRKRRAIKFKRKIDAQLLATPIRCE
ncbi:MAG: hypothetical protein H7A51_17675 [Akkermansiaceae bacterium]|nr:hypothetical protein [Akkermansiaceae bacterium]